MVVLRDHVLLEEAEGLHGGGRGQPYEEGVEVVEHLPPEVVDGAVALVGDDDVEGVDWYVGVVHDGRGLSAKRGRVEAGKLLLVGVELFALEDGVDALDGGDADTADRVDARGLEVLDVVELGEFAFLVRGGESLELAQGLASQVAAVDEEEHPPFAPAYLMSR